MVLVLIASSVLSVQTISFARGDSPFTVLSVSGGLWTNMSPTTRPSGGGAMAYDSKADRVIFFGGGAEGLGNETWSYDFNVNTWTKLSPSTSPAARSEHSMAYDSKADRVIIFGGTKDFQRDNDETWAYDPNANTWTKMSPIAGPSALHSTGMAYDTRAGRVLMFGGLNERGTGSNETWAYEFGTNAWVNMRPSVSPPETAAPIVYDSQSDRVIYFGAKSGELVPWTGTTWAYDFNSNTWTNMSPSSSPSPRWGQPMAYDSKADRVIIFGGIAQGFDNRETWGYSLSSNAWTNMSPTIYPSAVFGASMAYDSQSDRVIFFGGAYNVPRPPFHIFIEETWAYDFGARAGPTASPPWVVYATMAGAGVAVAAVVSVLLWRRRGRARTPPPPPGSP